MVRLTAIYTYPIKACGGIARQEASIEARGLSGDRRYMLVDGNGRFISQREQPRLALIGVAERGDGYVVEAPGCPPLELPRVLESRRNVEVAIWRDRVGARLADTAVNRWFGGFLGIDCSLVYMSDTDHRPVANPAAASGDEVSFADGSPLLLISEASLAALNARLAKPVPMRRFRPNLVVTAEREFAEDDWRRIAIGSAELAVGWPCPRCIVTTVDPETGIKDADGEPLETLKTFRRIGRGVMFGQNLLPRKPGSIRIGDDVRIQ
jgi:uncharacterized protein